MEARKADSWGRRYTVTDGGRELTVWDSSFWRGGGAFELGGRRYEVRPNVWGSRYAMVDDAGTLLAKADRIGRRRWAVQAGEQTYHFRRRSLWGHEEELLLGDSPVGSVRQTSFWRGDVALDLPGLPQPLQVFVLGVVLSMWRQQAAAAAS
jgi:hypothetical protein